MLGQASDVADDGHATPPSGADDPIWHELSPHAVRIWQLRATATATIGLIVVWTATFAISAAELRLPPRLDVVMSAAIVTIVFVTWWAIAVSVAGRRRRAWRWGVSDQRLVVERGWWRHRRLQAPIDDIHTITQRTGPLLRAWNASEIAIYASGPIGSVTLPIVDDNAIPSLRIALGFDR